MSVISEALKCAICHETMATNPWVINRCDHAFHYNCIEGSIVQEGPAHDKCPTCRQTIDKIKQSRFIGDIIGALGLDASHEKESHAPEGKTEMTVREVRRHHAYQRVLNRPAPSLPAGYVPFTYVRPDHPITQADFAFLSTDDSGLFGPERSVEVH